jgi:hypothetical protein
VFHLAGIRAERVLKRFRHLCAIKVHEIIAFGIRSCVSETERFHRDLSVHLIAVV